MCQDHKKRACDVKKRYAFEHERDPPRFVEEHDCYDGDEYRGALIEDKIYVHYRYIIQENIRNGVARANGRVDVGVISDKQTDAQERKADEYSRYE